MAKSIYYPEEVKEIMDNIIEKEMWRLLNLDTMTDDRIVANIVDIRKHREFAKLVCNALEGDDDADT